MATRSKRSVKTPSKPGKSAEDYVHESIVEPDAYTVSGFGKGVMPSYEGKLSDKQLEPMFEQWRRECEIFGNVRKRYLLY